MSLWLEELRLQKTHLHRGSRRWRLSALGPVPRSQNRTDSVELRTVRRFGLYAICQSSGNATDATDGERALFTENSHV